MTMPLIHVTREYTIPTIGEFEVSALVDLDVGTYERDPSVGEGHGTGYECTDWKLRAAIVGGVVSYTKAALAETFGAGMVSDLERAAVDDWKDRSDPRQSDDVDGAMAQLAGVM